MDGQSLAAIGMFAIAGIIAFNTWKKRRKYKEEHNLPTVKKGWRIHYSTGMPATPTMDAGGAWHVVFPAGANSHHHYVQCDEPPKN